MTFVYKHYVKKDDADYQKIINLDQRYMEETPKEILETHNYAYAHLGDKRYREIFPIGSRGAYNIVSDDERKIVLLMIHECDGDYNYCQTPDAWVLFFEHYMILINFYHDCNVGPLENGHKWYKDTFLVEPLVLPDSIQNREEEIKRYILEALTVYSDSDHNGGTLLKFTRGDCEVIFDQPYQFRGYNT
ncbi:hypothetical protein A7P53_04755 [Acinetobacter defluvii]|uniref:hypothetical protein n=1 Tax=Acinetobacter defluvii TaxID=1871111 RepID=UPI00148F6C07|nr:hypothetical protein [Acinetobacter defluvii]NNP71779.1 hypothetical protein [Acinetobacter defluvii]